MENVDHKIVTEKFQVETTDGVILKGILLLPEKPKALLQFNGGTAAKKEFYLPFLTYLSQHGYLCCLWDYRGSGESAPPDMSVCDYRLIEYGTKDMPAIKNYLTERFPDLPFLFFGHSAGGQLVGFMNNLKGVVGMVNFAVSTGYLSDMPLGYRLSSYYFFFIFSPLSILFTGYVNAKRFGIMEDLPRNVLNEWKSWCLKKDYFFDERFYGKTIPRGSFKKLDFPIHVFWTEDDTISNEKNTKVFWKHIQSSEPIEFTRISPADLGVKSIGHFGFFKKQRRDSLWPKALKQLDNYV